MAGNEECNDFLVFPRESCLRDRGAYSNQNDLRMVESSPGQVEYIHRADAASQIDENNELMPNTDGREHSLDRLPARVLIADIALF